MISSSWISKIEYRRYCLLIEIHRYKLVNSRIYLIESAIQVCWTKKKNAFPAKQIDGQCLPLVLAVVEILHGEKVRIVWFDIPYWILWCQDEIVKLFTFSYVLSSAAGKKATMTWPKYRLGRKFVVLQRKQYI